MKKIKVGIIGSGFIGEAHIEAMRRLNFIEVIALAENDVALAKKRAEELNIPGYYGDYKELLKNEEIDAIHNCTPNFLHCEINIAAMKANKNVFSEKPLAVSYKQAKELTQVAEDSDVYNGVNFNYRHYPLVKEMKNKIKNEAGNINIVQGYYLQDWLLYDTDYNWRVNSEAGGESRAIADIGSHWCDLVQFLTDSKIKKVFSNLKIIHPYRKKPAGENKTFEKNKSKEAKFDKISVNTEDYGSVLLELENGAVGNFTVSQVSAGHKNDLFVEINGSENTYSWSQENANQLFIGHRDKANEILLKDPGILSEKVKKDCYYPGGHIEGWSEGLKNSIKDFYNCILAAGDPADYDFATFADGALEVKITEAILKSSREEKWVEV
ncbi:putative dehydrogenase [Halanaerobium congolense]|uniref:Putative dehydrogenase n=1 Tax=Halanaerobium congolense TaxID=54121 RepID=A0A4R8GKL7_9FIRM|nr:Gfo/Idh/MocA family oxidoreductase [Halanaerobium congolense]TDX42891.1 putative dehydrogenase [Halanaerobium congolense]